MTKFSISYCTRKGKRFLKKVYSLGEAGHGRKKRGIQRDDYFLSEKNVSYCHRETKQSAAAVKELNSSADLFCIIDSRLIFYLL